MQKKNTPEQVIQPGIMCYYRGGFIEPYTEICLVVAKDETYKGSDPMWRILTMSIYDSYKDLSDAELWDRLHTAVHSWISVREDKLMPWTKMNAAPAKVIVKDADDGHPASFMVYTEDDSFVQAIFPIKSEETKTQAMHWAMRHVEEINNERRMRCELEMIKEYFNESASNNTTPSDK